MRLSLALVSWFLNWTWALQSAHFKYRVQSILVRTFIPNCDLTVRTTNSDSLFLAASEAGFDDVSEAEEGLISNGEDMEDLLERTRNDLGPVIRNAEQPQRPPGKY